MSGFCGSECGWGPRDSFICIACGFECCYCMGASDPDPVLAECCDECWSAITHGGRQDLLEKATHRLQKEAKP